MSLNIESSLIYYGRLYDNKYLFICKYNNKLESVYNDVWTFLNIYDETFSSDEFDLFYLDVDNFTFETLKSEQTYSCYNIEDDQDTKITLDLKFRILYQVSCE